jgi:hypothetical protein
MSQNDFTIANQGFPAFRADLNSALQALASNSSGATAPSTTFANMWWYDSANNIMYIRNEDNDAWIKFAELDQTNDKFVLSGTLQLDDGTVSAPALTFNSDTNMGIYRGGTDILKFVTAGTDAITIDASQNTTFAGSVSANSLETLDGVDIDMDSDGSGQIKIDGNGFKSAIALNAQGMNVYTNSSGRDLILGTNEIQRLRIEGNGDINFYEETGTTPKLFWDASAEFLGIGTSSPTEDLDITKSTTVTLHLERSGATALDITASTAAVGAAYNSSYFHQFQTSGTERLRIDSDGIKFNGDTSADNALSDYEEGTWTPVMATNSGNASTATFSQAVYTKIGRVVYINAKVNNIDASGTTSTSELRVAGLPFTCDVIFAMGTCLYDSVATQGSRTQITVEFNASEYIRFFHCGGSGTDTVVDHGDITNNVSDIFFTGFYFTSQ